ncbi:hypothetical protein DBR11_11085 [Pedobacter sp. HMWF019]|nr:hypothetical protein DBR11_11085 [Pedobacter sp. HMWF019]
MYDQELKRKWDNEAVREQSFLDGEQTKALEIARAMKEKGFESFVIAELTNLAIEEIEKL